MTEPVIIHHQQEPKKKKPFVRYGLILFAIIFVAWLFSLKNVIGIENGSFWQKITQPAPTPDDSYQMPEKEADRLDILLLGIRGLDDPDASDGGPLLTDSIEILSYDMKTHDASMVSLPRDLEVITHDQHRDKLNTVYEYGYYHSSDPLLFSKIKFSQITGIYIDKIVVLNFASFKEIVDSLGGVDVKLDKPFSEDKQWGYPFHLPAGINHLDGQNALYFARSRYSSTDFDRAQRQQQLMLAIKDKLVQLDYIHDPVKSFNVFNTIRKNIATDIGVLDINQFLNLAHTINFEKIRKYVISDSNLVYDTRNSAGSYILIPNGGNFDKIKKLFKDILYGGPLPTAVPTQVQK